MFGVLALLVGVFLGGQSTDEAALSPQPAPADAAEQAPAVLDYDIPASEPAGLVWQTVELGRGSTSIPFSGEHGPAVAQDGQWSGWAQTPTGALLAAWTIQQAAGIRDNAALANYWRQQAITDPETLNLAVDSRPMNSPEIEVTPMGFEIINYSPIEVTVRLATAYEWGSQRTQESSTVKVRWQNGDWRLVMLSDDRPRSQELSAEWPYIPWGG